MMNDKLLSDVDINRVKDRFEKEISEVLDEAIKKHVSAFFNFIVLIAQYIFRKYSILVVCSTNIFLI